VNRWIRLGAAVTAMVMIANLQYGWTLFTGPLTQATGWKLSEVQWGWTLFVALETWAMSLCGWMIDKRGPRVLMTIAGVFCGVGWAGLGQAPTLTALYASYALAGLGAAMVYCGCIGVALKWFPDKRGAAAGTIAAGFGAGASLFIPVMSYIIRVQDYRAAFLYTGIVQGLLIVVAAQVVGGAGIPPVVAATAAKPRARSHGHNFNSVEMLQTPQFYVLYLAMLMMGIGGLMVTANASAVGKSLGIGSAFITTALSLNAVANGAGRFFWGWVSDHLGRERTMVIAFLLQSLCLASVPTVGKRSGPLFIISLALVFFTWGQVYSIFPSVTADFFGAKNASSNYSFMYSTKGVASIIGGGIAALLYERTGSWNGVFYGSAMLALCAAFIAMALRRMPLPARQEEPQPATVSPLGARHI
jgi:MFS transporter, OFA family, oxalate/formate antiporter